MVIQNSLKLLNELSDIEEKISFIKSHNPKLNDEVVEEMILNIFNKNFPD